MVRLAFGWVSVLCVATLFGGCQHGPAMYQVSGKVLYKDGSVPHAPIALVRFEPAGDSSAEIRKGASGAIGPDGSFTLFTRMPGDGVHRGEYNVCFTFCKSAGDTKPLILEKYADPNETPYKKVVVDHDLSDLKFEVEPRTGASGG